MNIQPLDIVIHLINIVVLYVILSKVLYKPVKAFLENRKDGIAKDLLSAKEAVSRAQKTQEEMDLRMKDADSRVENHLLEGMQKAGESANEIVVKAQQDAAKILSSANAQAQEIKKQAVRAAAPQMAQMALDLASEVLKREVKKEDQKQVIDDFVSRAV